MNKNKSRDPLGLANEHFRLEVSGEDLKVAVLKMMNLIKHFQSVWSPVTFHLFTRRETELNMIITAAFFGLLSS